MVIQCENCKRKYRLDDSRIKPPGSSVRCSKCGHIFFVSKKDEQEDIEKSLVTEESPLFEELDEEVRPEENDIVHNDNPEHEDNAPAEFTQGELEMSKQQEDVGDDMLDLPTDHEADLEEFIDDSPVEEETYSEPQEKEPENMEIALEEEKIHTEEPILEEPDIDSKEPANLLEEQEDSAEVVDDTELEKTPSFDEDNTLEEKSSDEYDFDSSTLKLKKSGSGFLAKIIYSLITIAAVFVIFIASLVLLINSEILPKGTLSSLLSSVDSITPFELTDTDTPVIIISEHQARWLNTRNGPIYVVSGLITNESTEPVHYIRLKSEYNAGEKKQFEDTFYAGNTFTDKELKDSTIESILQKLDQRNGDIDVNNSRKLAGLNYNIQPGESIPFFTVFPAGGRLLGLKYNLEVIDYKPGSAN